MSKPATWVTIVSCAVALAGALVGPDNDFAAAQQGSVGSDVRPHALGSDGKLGYSEDRWPPNLKLGEAINAVSDVSDAREFGLTHQIHIAVDPADIPGAEARIFGALAAAPAALDREPIGDELDVSLNASFHSVEEALGVAVCNRALPKTFDPALCATTAVNVVRQGAMTLLKAFPMIKYWDAANEPEDGGTPSAPDLGGVNLAVQEWAAAKQDAVTLNQGQDVAPTNMWDLPSAYARSFLQAVAAIDKERHWTTTFVTAHPYKTVLCGTMQSVRAFVGYLKADGLYRSIRTIIYNEAGVDLSPSVIHCANATALSATYHAGESLARFYRGVERAEVRSSEALIDLARITPTKPVVEDIYIATAIDCGHDVRWDSAPTGQNDALRILGYILKRLPLPTRLTDPTPKQLRQAVLTDVSATGFAGCKYGQGIHPGTSVSLASGKRRRAGPKRSSAGKRHKR